MKFAFGGHFQKAGIEKTLKKFVSKFFSYNFVNFCNTKYINKK